MKARKNIFRQTILFSGFILISLTLTFCASDKGQKKDPAVPQTTQYYINPVIGGDYADPSVLRDGKDFYITHSSFNYYPGLLIWHSTDLIHWKRISHALNKNVGSVWAPDFIKLGDTYYIYFPAGGTNWVVTAKSPYGPWSDPVDLKLKGYIDPGHLVGPDGKRYLYLSEGYIVKLTDDGLATDGVPVTTYNGWKFPETWSTECFCLESPKSNFKDGYYYITVAEGGTAGPATSHMVVNARSKSPFGPWENSPYNPIVHTAGKNEVWWSQGHGTLVEDTKGQWWIMYHGYLNGFHTLGRQTLMLPVEWTSDGWYKITDGIKSSDKIQAPAGEVSVSNTELSDDFSGNKPGMQWQFYKKYEPERAVVKDGKMKFAAEGSSFDDSSPLLVNVPDKSYELQVEFTIEDGVAAGLCLYYNEAANASIAATTEQFSVLLQKNTRIDAKNNIGKHGFLKIVNNENEVSFYFSKDGKTWNRADRSIEVSGYHHNVFGEFLSLKAGVFAFGKGEVVFDNFIYRKI
jgi:xylan 1,4-beta-xylosidase